MRQSTVEQSTITYKGILAQMLPWLPTPGNQGFLSLAKALGKHGLSPAGIELEAPSSRLNDVVLTMSLLDDRVKVKLSYGWFEFLISNLYEGDEPSLIDIADGLFATLREIDGDMKQKSGEYRSYAHLKMLAGQADALIRENLGSANSSAALPDAFAYQLKWKELKEEEQARIVVAKSLRLPDGLFIDLAIEYVSPDEPARMVERINQDYDRALSILGLQTVGELNET
jgi:hypothetical protein